MRNHCYISHEYVPDFQKRKQKKEMKKSRIYYTIRITAMFTSINETATII